MPDPADSPLFRYAAEVPDSADETLISRLSAHLTEMSHFLGTIPEDKAGFAYAPGKWTVRQVAGHILVSQRIFATRAVAIGRGETQPLPGYDENLYAQRWPGPDVTMGEIAAAYQAEARATQFWALLLEEDELGREGTANGLAVTPDKLLRALIGHERHHRQVLIERYGIENA